MFVAGELEKELSERNEAYEAIFEDAKRIAEANEEELCCICMENAPNTVLLPCRHLGTCRDCADNCNRCPLCKSNIDEKHTCFMPAKQKKVPLRILTTESNTSSSSGGPSSSSAATPAPQSGNVQSGTSSGSSSHPSQL